MRLNILEVEVEPEVEEGEKKSSQGSSNNSKKKKKKKKPSSSSDSNKSSSDKQKDIETQDISKEEIKFDHLDLNEEEKEVSSPNKKLFSALLRGDEADQLLANFL